MPKTKISWTDEAWNWLTWNCDTVSPGCKHCFARAHSQRYPQNSAGGQFAGAPNFRPKALEELRLIKSGSTVFVNTHSDTFHKANSIDTLARMFQHMNQRPDLIFLLLTKRPEIALSWAEQLRWTDNIWLGVSVESATFLRRLDLLRLIPAAHRFVSFEPLLAYIPQNLIRPALQNIDWVIVGGESGQEYRPFMKEWAVDIQRISSEFKIPFYFKQGSGLYPESDRILNGKTYDEFPLEFDQLHRQYEVKAVQTSLF